VTTCCGLLGGKRTNATPAQGTNNADSEGSALDDVDLEAGRGGGLTEKTPLLRQASGGAKSATYGDSQTALSPEEQEDEEQGDLPDETPVAAAGADAAPPAKAPKRKRKKRMSMYDSTMHALGFTPAPIEHAAEVQLMTADGSPAGKVRHLASFAILFSSSEL
jgi:hypothetical protein